MAAAFSVTDDDLTTCSVCFEVYNSRKNCPKFLSCHHTFCVACLQGIRIFDRDWIVKCPTCREVTRLRYGDNVAQLRTNAHALKLVEYESLAQAFARNAQVNESLTASNSRFQKRITELERDNQRLADDLKKAVAATKGLIPQTVKPKKCHLSFYTSHLFDDDLETIVLETQPHVASRLVGMFHCYCTEDSTINYVGSTFLSAVPNLYVKFGKPGSDCIDLSLKDLPMIQERGDVGLYCEDVNTAKVWNFVILLGDYRRSNLRPAPLIAKLVSGFSFCENLSRLPACDRSQVCVEFVSIVNP